METPEYDLYKYDTMEGACPKATPEELEPTPDTAPDHYLNLSVVLPRGGYFARGKVIGLKQDPGGNKIGRANAQPVFDTRRYEVEFGDGDNTKIIANVITE